MLIYRELKTCDSVWCHGGGPEAEVLDDAWFENLYAQFNEVESLVSTLSQRLYMLSVARTDGDAQTQRRDRVQRLAEGVWEHWKATFGPLSKYKISSLKFPLFQPWHRMMDRESQAEWELRCEMLAERWRLEPPLSVAGAGTKTQARWLAWTRRTQEAPDARTNG